MYCCCGELWKISRWNYFCKTCHLLKPFQSCFSQFGNIELYKICSISIGSVFLLLSLLSWQNTCIKIWNIWLTGQRKKKRLTKGPSMSLPNNFTDQIYQSDLLVLFTVRFYQSNLLNPNYSDVTLTPLSNRWRWILN